MSKMDGLRAMREARYEAAARAAKPATKTAAKTGAKTGAKASKRPSVAPPATSAEPAETTPAAAEGLCGHKAISGRTCTRERGHSAKSHRYS